MLAAHCPRHDATVLVTTSRIESVQRDGDGFCVRFRCTCGERSTTRVSRRA